MTDPMDKFFLVRQLRDMRNQNREQFDILRAELVRTQEGIDRIEGKLSSYADRLEMETVKT